jgi:uncharacterized protein involved in exopolysaccharide biosynthesis
LLAVFQPFDRSASAVVTADTDADALRARIDGARAALAETDAALDAAGTSLPAATSPGPDTTVSGQYEMQIAAATERRDLARRHAAAIRDGLKSGLPVASLAEIRDSVVIGQLLSQEAALESQIAEQGARFKSSHPVMRALLAQRDALAAQIRTQAASVAAALEAEADLDDKQIALLRGQLGSTPLAVAPAPAAAMAPTELRATAAAQRAELDALMDAYLKLPPAAAATTSRPDLLSPPNVAVAAFAGIVALLSQVAIFAGRRRRNTEGADLAAWQADDDEPELPLAADGEDDAPLLRRAS